MTLLSITRKLLCCLLAVCLVAATSPGSAAANGRETIATFRGVIFEQDERTPLAGAALIALNVATGETRWNRMTGADGVYEFAGLTPGAYEIAIEVAGSLFVAEAPLELTAGEDSVIYLAAVPGVPARQEIPFLSTPAGVAKILEPDRVPGAPEQRSKKRRYFLIGTGSVFALLLVGAAGGGDGESGGREDPVSRSQP